MGADARRAAVLGSPIAHSLSPILHRAAYARLGLRDWVYGAYEVDEASLPEFLAGTAGSGPGSGLPESFADTARPGLGSRPGSRIDLPWAGLSLTMPLKRAVIPLLDEITPTARAVDAVNTVLFHDDGSRTGTNTDVPGLVAALAERGIREVGSAAVLGAGATASSALAALSTIVSGEVEVYLRSTSRVAEIETVAERYNVKVRIREWADAARAFDAELVVATTPAGACDELAASVPGSPGALFDVLYHPWPTPLAEAWESAGGLVIGGLSLLIHQAALQVELMTGIVPAPLAVMRTVGETALSLR